MEFLFWLWVLVAIQWLQTYWLWIVAVAMLVGVIGWLLWELERKT